MVDTTPTREVYELAAGITLDVLAARHRLYRIGREADVEFRRRVVAIAFPLRRVVVDMTMRERIARAICQADEQNGGAPWDWYCSDKARSNYFDAADQVLTEMREPTDTMVIACADLLGSQIEIWKRSIDAAVAEGA